MEFTQDDVIWVLKLIDESPMGRVCLKFGELTLELVKATDSDSAPVIPATAWQQIAPTSGETRLVEAQPTSLKVADRTEPESATSTDADLLVIKAPLLGIFYRKPQPGSPPYVEVGSLVDEDTTVAILEVMKLFTPVKAGVKGRRHEICVEDRAFVEYNQVLFLVKSD